MSLYLEEKQIHDKDIKNYTSTKFFVEYFIWGHNQFAGILNVAWQEKIYAYTLIYCGPCKHGWMSVTLRKDVIVENMTLNVGYVIKCDLL